ncbi:MAG: hypothetical protein M2R45_02509 [Verrucomicrobia subdivision 3 bacterium]|nr:hypothetical protein [Limisphaerales bacterium]MCS1414284.1 hypothetical protein [Limisphaerales bacterium]
MRARKDNPLYGKFNDLVESLVQKKPDKPAKAKHRKIQQPQRCTYSAVASQKSGQTEKD